MPIFENEIEKGKKRGESLRYSRSKFRRETLQDESLHYCAFSNSILNGESLEIVLPRKLNTFVQTRVNQCYKRYRLYCGFVYLVEVLLNWCYGTDMQ